MPSPFDIRKIADELRAVPQGWGAFVHRITGEVVTIPVDGDSADHDVEELEEILEGPDWLALPDAMDIHAWEIMERFALSRSGEKERDALDRAVHGRGAFRNFRDTAERLGLLDAWFAFELAAYETKVRSCLRAHELWAEDGTAT